MASFAQDVSPKWYKIYMYGMFKHVYDIDKKIGWRWSSTAYVAVWIHGIINFDIFTFRSRGINFLLLPSSSFFGCATLSLCRHDNFLLVQTILSCIPQRTRAPVVTFQCMISKYMGRKVSEKVESCNVTRNLKQHQTSTCTSTSVKNRRVTSVAMERSSPYWHVTQINFSKWRRNVMHPVAK